MKKLNFKRLMSLLVSLLMTISIVMAAAPGKALAAGTQNFVNLQILATSDLHGRFMPYQYALDAENTSGSLAQIATYVKEARKANPNTILVDNGDTIQDNFSNLFLNDSIHPMILAMNEIGYDTWTLGNHEFNYGVPTLEKIMAQSKAKVLGGNVYKPNGERLAAPYAIIERGGIKVGIVGMTNPNITKWDAANLQGYTVKSPVEEVKKAVEELKGKVDVIIAVIHVGPTPEYGNDDGADLIAKAIPDLDVIVAGHAHLKVADNRIGNVLITEPNYYGTNISKIDIMLTKNASGKYVIADRMKDIKATMIDVKNYASDEALSAKLKPYHDRAISDARTVIGKLEDGDLVPEDEVKGIPTCQIQDNAMIDLINDVQMYYTGAEVSAAAAFSTTANIKKGDIPRAGVASIYKYDNTLYKLQITGKQLKKYMEWSAAYYNTFKNGDLTISFNPSIKGYNYDMFSGVKYQIDISKEPGSRIVNLTKMDGTPVKDDDIFILAVNNYRANTQLLTPGVIYDADDMPKLLEKDVKQGAAVRDLIADYIQNVKKGVIKPTYDNNWKLIGYSYDNAKRAKAVEAINSGKLSLPASADGRTPNVRSIVWSDVPTKEINIVSFNDFHGSLKPEGKNIGAAKLAGEINRIKANNPDTIIVSGGDIYQGSAMSNLTYGKPVSEFLKAVGVTASAVGNHEFDWGVDKIEGWAKDGNFDFLASNIYDKTTGQPVSWAKPYKIVNAGGKRIAFIGLTTPETAYKTKPDIVKNLEFKDPIVSAQYWTDYIKTNSMADYVIALTHLGSYQDSKTKDITGEAADLAKNVNKLDGIISAHTHQAVSGYINNIPVVQGYYNGRTLAKLTLQFNDEGKLLGIKPSIDNLYSRTDLVEDEAVKAIYNDWNIKLKPILDEVVGKTDVELPHDKNLGVSLLGEWTCDVMRKAAGTQIAITNGGGLRTSIPAGDITMGKLYEVMPFDNTLVKMELKGSDLKKAVENGILNTNVGWVQLSGVKVYYDPKALAGSRITSMRLPDGTKVEDNKYYTVVTNDFMATGGDGYDFKGAVKVVDTGVPIRDALVNEIKSQAAAGKSLNPSYVEYLIAGADPVQPAKQALATPTVKTVKIVALKGLRIRAAANSSSKVLGVYRNGTEVVVEGEVGNWYKVNYNGTYGFIYKGYTK